MLLFCSFIPWLPDLFKVHKTNDHAGSLGMIFSLESGGLEIKLVILFLFILLFFLVWLPFLTLRVTPGVDTVTVPAADDGTSTAIHIPTGFPIGNSNQSTAYVSTNEIYCLQHAAQLLGKPSQFQGSIQNSRRY